MNLENLESRIQTKLENIDACSDTICYMAKDMRQNNRLEFGAIIGILAQCRKILDECERLKAVYNAMDWKQEEEEKEEEVTE